MDSVRETIVVTQRYLDAIATRLGASRLYEWLRATGRRGLEAALRRPPRKDGLSGDWRAPAAKGFAVVFVTFVLFGGWACLAPIDGAVVAQGSIVVESDRKAVQHLEGGIVKELEVTDDAHVEKDQVLVRLDPTQASASEQVIRAGICSALAEAARLEADIADSDAITFPPELTEHASDPAASRAMTDQLQQFRERQSADRLAVSILRERIGQAEQQIQSAQAQRESAETQMESVADEYRKLKPLADRGYIPVTRVSTLRRSQADLKGRVGSLAADILRFRQVADEARLQVNQVRRKTAEQASAKLVETRGRLADLREKLRVASNVLARNEVRAPRAGRVVNLKVHTIGAVIRPGEVLMEVVPDNDDLIVSAKMSPLDVNHVHVGLPAEVRLPSFKARTTPLAIGEVRSVSADAVSDPATHREFYEIKVSVRSEGFPDNIRKQLKPGMPAEVFVETGARTVLAYLTQPLVDAIRRGMRED
jgi:HlyD family type I secretion membrane fusion protein